MYKKIGLIFCLFLAVISFVNAQEGIPVYSDYLSDNYYLIHPSMAGSANCAKVRITGRKQWFGQDDAPALQTASFNGRVTENMGGGIILFNDKNGYHSQQGAKLTYAYHLLFSRDEIDLNQLSFGVSAGLIQNQLDETKFLQNEAYDPIISGKIQKSSYFNMDLGVSYNYLDFYAHATVQGLIETRRSIYSLYESDNLRKYLFSAGYTFGNKDSFLWEPSVLFMLFEKTKEKTFDVNIKTYKYLDFGNIWAALSYRRSFDNSLDKANNIKSNLQYITPILGLNFGKYMFAYTYSHFIGNEKFDSGGYHQITFGMNLFCKPEKYVCNCPAVN